MSLEIDSVLKSFDERVILSDIYLECKPGDIIGLFGRNGCGKSTFLKIIFGTLKGDRSFLRINGQVINTQGFRSGLIGYLPQVSFLPPNLYLSDIVKLYLPPSQHKSFFGDPFLFKERNRKVIEISGGTQRYVEIKLILYSHYPYILLDEPFNGLSPVAAEAIRQHIQTVHSGKGIILTDHNYREVHKIVNRLLWLQDGYLKDIKNPRDLISHGYYEE